MTTAGVLPAAACPDCRAPLRATATCPSCGLPLRGPDAARLWEVDVELGRLEGRRLHLLTERGRLLARLRAATGSPPGRVPAREDGNGSPAGGGAGRAARQEWSPQRVQNLLLALGALLLAVAATVFGAVTYDRLGVGGRAAVLVALTGVAAAAAPRLRARGLGATAESVAAVALALAALDAWGVRRLGPGAGLDDAVYATAAVAGVATASATYAVVTGLRVPRLGAVALAHLAAVLGVVALEPSAAVASLLLSLVAAVDLGVVAAVERRGRTTPVRDLLGTASTGGALAAVSALLGAGVAAAAEQTALPLAVVAGVVAGVAVTARSAGRAGPLAALAVVLLTAAAVVQAHLLGAADRWLPALAATVAVTVAVALLAGAAVAGPLPGRGRRGGTAVGAGLVVAAALLAVLGQVLSALLGPAGWLGQPWSAPAGASAREVVAPQLAWTGSAAVAVTTAVAALAAACTGRLLGRAAAGDALAGALALLTLLLAPVALDLPLAAGLVLLLVGGGALVAGADVARTRAPRAATALLGAAAAPLALAVAWATADRTATLLVLAVTAVLLAGAAARPGPASARAATTALACSLAGAELAALAAARGLDAPQVGGLLLVAPAVVLLLARLPVDRPRREALQGVAGVLATASVLLAVADPGWLSWTLAGAGLLALLTALEADRRRLAAAGGLLLTASSWVRLAEAGVDAPEAYAVPLGLLALALGHLRVRQAPDTGSHAAYGPGLGLVLLPSLVAAVTGTGLARPLLLGLVALAVVGAGAARRLQAPLLLGAGTLVVLALHLLAPYAAAVPRWTALAAAGTALVVVGATFEQRRREVAVLRDRYAALH